MITLRVAQHGLTRCAKGRKLNCPGAMNCALRHMHLRVAPDTEQEGNEA
ncbi:hypothetical protein A2U01_0067699, partial [Trifolium medium]|nr:hypothetical protein [Trifolium medium]